MVSHRFPIYNDAVAQFRGINDDGRGGSQWQWGAPGKEGGATLWTSTTGPVEGARHRIKSEVPRWSWPLSGLGSFLLLGLVVWAGVSLTLAVTRQVFGLGVRSAAVLDPRDSERGALEENLLLLRPPEGVLGDLQKRPDCEVRDLSDPAVPDQEAASAGSGKEKEEQVVVLLHFDHGLREAEQAKKRLQLLETLVLARRRRVVLVSEIDPLYYLAPRELPPKPDPALDEEFARWSRVLAGFRKVRYVAGGGTLPEATATSEGAPRGAPAEGGNDLQGIAPPGSPLSKSRRALDCECGDDPSLARLAADLRDHPGLAALGGRQVVELVRDRAEAYYHTLWGSCSTREKLVLIDLAKDGFVNPKSWEVVRRLHHRRLIASLSPLRVKNRSCRAFVLSVERPETVARREKEQGPSAWSRAQGPLALAAVAAAAFFLYTQRDSGNTAIGVVTSLPAAIPALLRLFSTIQGGRPAPSEPA